jgi:hypothetical protein
MASGDTLATFIAEDNEPPSSNFASVDQRNGHQVLDFDTTTQETAIFSAVMPAHYANTTGITIKIWGLLASATSGTLGWDVALERMDAGTDLDADSFGSATTVTATTVPGTSGAPLVLSVNVTAGANMDSVVAGDAFRLRIRRDVANDTAAGDAQLLAVEIKET